MIFFFFFRSRFLQASRILVRFIFCSFINTNAIYGCCIVDKNHHNVDHDDYDDIEDHWFMFWITNQKIVHHHSFIEQPHAITTCPWQVQDIVNNSFFFSFLIYNGDELFNVIKTTTDLICRSAPKDLEILCLHSFIVKSWMLLQWIWVEFFYWLKESLNQ